MSDVIQFNSELTVEEINAIKYCPKCEGVQHCGVPSTYAVQDDDGNLTGSFAVCTECNCSDCEAARAN